MLEHPFGHEKKRLLGLVLSNAPTDCQMISRSLGALFPELYLRGDRSEYGEYVIKPFRPRDLKGGDQSAELIRLARTELLELKKTDDSYSSLIRQAVEEMDNKQRAALFLASHYYRYSMFAWFWKMFEIAKEDAHFELFHHAGEVSFFEQKPMGIIRSYFQRCLELTDDLEKKQRVWNKLSVLYGLRQEYGQALITIEMSMSLIQTVRDPVERQCRLAECHNARGLIFYKQEDYRASDRELALAFEIITECQESDSRAHQIKLILEKNRQRIRALLKDSGGD